MHIYEPKFTVPKYTEKNQTAHKKEINISAICNFTMPLTTEQIRGPDHGVFLSNAVNRTDWIIKVEMNTDTSFAS